MKFFGNIFENNLNLKDDLKKYKIKFRRKVTRRSWLKKRKRSWLNTMTSFLKRKHFGDRGLDPFGWKKAIETHTKIHLNTMTNKFPCMLIGLTNKTL